MFTSNTAAQLLQCFAVLIQIFFYDQASHVHTLVFTIDEEVSVLVKVFMEHFHGVGGFETLLELDSDVARLSVVIMANEQ